MRYPVISPTLTIVLFLGITGCGAETGNAWSDRVSHKASKGEIRMTSNNAPKRSNSPAQNYATLDQYLAHLKKLGAQDYPFYELVGPNRYKLNIGRGGNRVPARYFTRDQLMTKFGFTR